MTQTLKATDTRPPRNILQKSGECPSSKTNRTCEPEKSKKYSQSHQKDIIIGTFQSIHDRLLCSRRRVRASPSRYLRNFEGNG